MYKACGYKQRLWCFLWSPREPSRSCLSPLWVKLIQIARSDLLLQRAKRSLVKQLKINTACLQRHDVLIVTRLPVMSTAQNLRWETETYRSVQPTSLFGDKTQGRANQGDIMGYIVGRIRRPEQPRIAQ